MSSKTTIQKRYKKRIIFITGAAHGIGLSLAKVYDQQGAVVVGCDINEKALEQAREELPRAHFYKCDITKKEEVYALGKKVRDEVGLPWVLINNAGVVENSNMLDCPDHLIERTMNVNVMAHFWVCKAFLPEMVKRKEGHLCQIASAAGLIGVPGMVAYCTSKHAAVGFGNAMRLELEALSEGTIKTTVVCPSFVNTGLFTGVKTAMFTPMLDQDKIAQIIFSAIDQDQEMVMEPFMVKTIPFLKAFLPTRPFNKVLELFKVTSSMEDILKKKEKH